MASATNPETEIRDLKSQIASLEKSLSAHVRATGNGVSNKIEHFAHRAGADLRDFADHKRDQALALRDEASSRIAKRPLSTTAAAFGVGFALAALLRR
ncbi:MAG: hypothetical protein CMM93_05825 [Rickettsiales bacterium]|nr:hypothetical protein [Rickettsiales bacterium]|tara:strand:+ start:709 stop:1002 length:294 start_codon:yes stop_codon:yes gene_type:complete